MGTTYTLKYSHSIQPVYQVQKDISYILENINNQMSTYQNNSEISIFNRIKSNLPYKISSDFYYVLEKSNYYYNLSKGLFDVTVEKLSSLWGFNNENFIEPSDKEIKRILSVIGFDKIQLLEDNTISKINNEVRINLNAIAKGYTLDKISNYLDFNNIESYMIEIGGEVKTKGKNPNGGRWRIGLSDFDIDIGGIVEAIEIGNNSMATSGDYRNFIVYNNISYSHIINPKTGYPADNNVISATVIANNCIDADALATLLNVMNIKKSIQLINNLDQVECFIVEKNGEVFNYYYSKNMKKYIN